MKNMIGIKKTCRREDAYLTNLYFLGFLEREGGERDMKMEDETVNNVRRK
jgi:hypothetical protein